MKCQAIRFTRARKPNDAVYTLHGQQLETVNTIKYLGVTISNNLTWNNHIAEIIPKATRTLGFLRRNLRAMPPSIKEHAYKALVRPQLEYCSSVWDPHTVGGAHKIEMVQRRAARWTLNRYHNTSSVSSMLDQLQWRPLAFRRTDMRLCVMYKIVNNIVSINPRTYLQPVTRQTRQTHCHSFIQYQCQHNTFQSSFFPTTIINWNSLPSHIITATNYNSFRHQVAELNHNLPY